MLKLAPEPADLNDSPDLGPPPIVHFEGDDPIKFRSAKESPRMDNPRDNEIDFPPSIFANLETRKKRRESSNLSQASKQYTLDAESSPPKQITKSDALSKHPLKSGAKRKFHTRDEDEDIPPEGFRADRKVDDMIKPISTQSKVSQLKSSHCQPKGGGELKCEKLGENMGAAMLKNRRALGSSKSI